MENIPRFFTESRNQCNFGLFFSKFGCHGNSLGSLKILDSVLEFANLESLLFVQKLPRFLAQNRNQCNFGLFLAKIWLPWQLSWLP